MTETEYNENKVEEEVKEQGKIAKPKVDKRRKAGGKSKAGKKTPVKGSPDYNYRCNIRNDVVEELRTYAKEKLNVKLNTTGKIVPRHEYTVGDVLGLMMERDGFYIPFELAERLQKYCKEQLNVDVWIEEGEKPKGDITINEAVTLMLEKAGY